MDITNAALYISDTSESMTGVMLLGLIGEFETQCSNIQVMKGFFWFPEIKATFKFIL